VEDLQLLRLQRGPVVAQDAARVARIGVEAPVCLCVLLLLLLCVCVVVVCVCVVVVCVLLCVCVCVCVYVGTVRQMNTKGRLYGRF